MIIADPSPHFDERKLTLSLIVLHYTNMASFGDALDILTGRNLENGRVSAHYAISQAGKIYSLVAEDKRAWHAGKSSFCGCNDMNSASIGIELDNGGDEHFRQNGVWPPYTQALMSSLIWLVRGLCSQHKIDPIHSIVGHCHVAPSRKIDPGPHFPWKTLWEELS